MKFIKFTGTNIKEVFGENITGTKLLEEFGLKLRAEYQFKNEVGHVGFSLMEVKDQVKVEKALRFSAVEVLETVEDVNKEIDNLYKAEYKVTSEALYNANLTKLINDGNINLDDMKAEWSQEEELEFLFNNGISGIWKKSKPAYVK